MAACVMMVIALNVSFWWTHRKGGSHEREAKRELEAMERDYEQNHR
jgi:hypothetical protein